MWPFRRKNRKVRRTQEQEPLCIVAEPDLPRSFGYKTVWWTLSALDVNAVANAIGLVNAQPCNWRSGIEASYGNGIFVCPPIEGWIMVTGARLRSSRECLNSLLALSLKFNDAQVFGTHRVVGYQAWARAINGELYRGFEYLGESGEILWDIGDNSTEKQLGLDFPNANDLASNSDDLEEFDYPNEEHVMEMSARWSIAPTKLDCNTTPGVGLIGFDAKLIAHDV